LREKVDRELKIGGLKQLGSRSQHVGRQEVYSGRQ
jgi:hypothetical protein